MQFKDDLERFSDAVLEELTFLTHKEQTKLVWANYVSYVLFFIGWAVGPLGKALNLKTPANTSE
jgi:hypothetical protein